MSPRPVFALAMALCFLAPSVDAAARGIDENFFQPGGTLDEGAVPSTSAEAAATGERMPDVIAATPSEMIYSAGKVFFALAFVSALIIGFNRYLKKTAFPGLADGLVKRIAIEPLAPNQFIHVVDVGGKLLVIGLNEKGMTKLAELDGEMADQVRLWRSMREDESATPGAFGRFLRSFGEARPAGPSERAYDRGLDDRRRSSGRLLGVAGSLASARDRLKEMAL